MDILLCFFGGVRFRGVRGVVTAIVTAIVIIRQEQRSAVHVHNYILLFFSVMAVSKQSNWTKSQMTVPLAGASRILLLSLSVPGLKLMAESVARMKLSPFRRMLACPGVRVSDGSAPDEEKCLSRVHEPYARSTEASKDSDPKIVVCSPSGMSLKCYLTLVLTLP
jgi:hypothetical protein